jgi:hypothetical protein
VGVLGASVFAFIFESFILAICAGAIFGIVGGVLRVMLDLEIADASTAHSPISTMRGARSFALVTVPAGVLTIWLIYGTGLSLLGVRPLVYVYRWIGMDPFLDVGLRTSLLSAFVTATEMALIGLYLGVACSAWGRFLIAQIWWAFGRRLPIPLMRFLEEAYEKQVLRQVGSSYQFRHRQLPKRLLARAAMLGVPLSKDEPMSRRKIRLIATARFLAWWFGGSNAWALLLFIAGVPDQQGFFSPEITPYEYAPPFFLVAGIVSAIRYLRRHRIQSGPHDSASSADQPEQQTLT